MEAKFFVPQVGKRLCGIMLEVEYAILGIQGINERPLLFS
jgi:hypothetical protein